MKYVISIITIAVVVTMVTGFYIFHSNNSGSVTDPELVINDRLISSTEFSEAYSRNVGRPVGRMEFAQSLITRTLLIQEARKSGIDKEEDFRRSIQNYYEQSLTKILLERMSNEFKYTPSRKEIERFLELQNYRVELNLQPVNSQSGSEEKIASLYRNLANSVQVALMFVEVGGMSRPIYLDELEYELNLVALHKIPAGESFDLSAEKAKEIIAREHQEQSLVKWLYELQKGAAVHVSASINEEK